MSKFIPNSYQTPNIIIDEMIDVLTDAEFKIYHLVIRNTTGWQKTISAKLTIDWIAGKLKKSRPTVIKALQGLKQLKLIKEHGSQKNGFSYSVNFEITGERKDEKKEIFKAPKIDKFYAVSKKEWLNILTTDKRFNGKDFLPSMVKYFNHLYILNTNFKHNIKKYIKKNDVKSEPKSKKADAPIDLLSKEVFNNFKTEFEFINFVDYERMVKHLQKLNGAISKSRIKQNLKKCTTGTKDGNPIDAKKFVEVVDDFLAQERYRGVFVSWHPSNRQSFLAKIDEVTHETIYTSPEEFMRQMSQMNHGSNRSNCDEF